MTQTTLEPQALTCAACPYFQPHNDGTNKGWCNLFNHFARETHPSTQDCINNISDEQVIVPVPVIETVVEYDFASSSVPVIETVVRYDFAIANGFTFHQKQCDVLCWIGKKDKYRTIAYPDLSNAVEAALRRLKKESITGASELLQIHVEAKKTKVRQSAKSVSGEQPVAQSELDQHIEEQAQELAPEFEVDSDVDADFGVLHRVWSSYHLLGTFYQDIEGKWVAQPCNSSIRPRLNTSIQAELVIIAASGYLVADSVA